MLSTRPLPVPKSLSFTNFQHRVFIEAKSALACTIVSIWTVTPPISDEMLGASKVRHNLLTNEPSDGGGSVIDGRPHYWPKGEIVDGRNDVLLV
ncbi:hypothetical protein DSO57_1018034 [Entomophthora muscae]|uniref:Uncharacterized protein n=1 Tax=Entomophthora muscae TaxID=34485 RepID=A0ACC2UPS1_9FUNG|nr:hypothetical protein DSO57_1018034 [Entomophthora muscae]